MPFTAAIEEIKAEIQRLSKLGDNAKKLSTMKEHDSEIDELMKELEELEREQREHDAQEEYIESGARQEDEEADERRLEKFIKNSENS